VDTLNRRQRVETELVIHRATAQVVDDGDGVAALGQVQRRGPAAIAITTDDHHALTLTRIRGIRIGAMCRERSRTTRASRTSARCRRVRRQTVTCAQSKNTREDTASVHGNVPRERRLTSCDIIPRSSTSASSASSVSPSSSAATEASPPPPAPRIAAKPRPTRAFWIKISIRASSVATNIHPSVRARAVERTRSTHSPLRELNALKHTPRRSFAPIALAVYDVRTRAKFGESIIFPHRSSSRVTSRDVASSRRRVVVVVVVVVVPLVAVRLVVVRALAHTAYVVVEQARAFIVVVVVGSNAVATPPRGRRR